MKRFLIALAVFTLAIYLLRRLRGVLEGRGGGTRARARPRGSGPGATELVRDRVCNTYLPRHSALTVNISGETHHFCSEACRARFAAGLPSTGARTAP